MITYRINPKAVFYVNDSVTGSNRLIVAEKFRPVF